MGFPFLNYYFVFSYTKEIGECFGWPLFVHYVCSALLLCIVLIQLANADLFSISFVSIFSFSVGILFQILVHCYYGNEVKIESGKIADAAYFSNWQNIIIKENTEVKKYILMIIIRSQAPSSVAITNVAGLDLITCVSILNAAFSYFAFLKNYA